MSWIWISVIVAAIVGAVWAIRATTTSDVIYEWETGLLYKNGKFERTLSPGRHRVFAMFDDVRITHVQTQYQWYMGPLSDVMSKDGLPFRLSANAFYTVTDARTFSEGSITTVLSNAVTIALADLATQYCFADVMKDRRGLDERFTAMLGQPCPEIEISAASISQIAFPPETRRLLAEVEKARLEGLAALERARGETAALRSLANAARLLKDNPELTNLRLLQAVQNAKGSSTIVLGQGSLMPGLSGAIDNPNNP